MQLSSAALFQGAVTETPSLASKQETPQKIREAAQQFEGVLIAQMLKSTHDGKESWMGAGDEAGGSAVEMAEEYFAKALSQNGGLGLARLVEAGLQRPKAQKVIE